MQKKTSFNRKYFKFYVILVLLTLGFFYRQKTVQSHNDTQASPSNISFIDMKLQNATDDKQKEKYLLTNFHRDHVIGDPKAPITIIEYYNYTCTFCRKLQKEVFPKIKKEFIDKGLVKYVFRPHINSKTLLLATSLKCLNNDLLREEFNNDYFFIKNSELSNLEHYLINKIKPHNLEQDRFKLCIYSKRNIDELLYYQNAETHILQIKGYPLLIINGQKYFGYRSYSEFKDLLNNLLQDRNHVTQN